MKKKLALLFTILLCVSGMVAPIANAFSINIDIGDQPYYIHGPGYWDGGVYWVWVPGHWGPHHRVWIHGHYVRR